MKKIKTPLGPLVLHKGRWRGKDTIWAYIPSNSRFYRPLSDFLCQEGMIKTSWYECEKDESITLTVFPQGSCQGNCPIINRQRNTLCWLSEPAYRSKCWFLRAAQSILTKLSSSDESSCEDSSEARRSASTSSEDEGQKAVNSDEAKDQKCSSEDTSSQEEKLSSDEQSLGESVESFNKASDSSKGASSSNSQNGNSGDDTSDLEDMSSSKEDISSEAEGRNRQASAGSQESEQTQETESAANPSGDCQLIPDGTDYGDMSEASEEETFDGTSNDFRAQRESSEASNKEPGINSTGPGSSKSERLNLWESFDSHEDEESFGGGKSRCEALTPECSTSKEVEYLLKKFFSSLEDIFRKENGFQRWWPAKVIKSAILQPSLLKKAKFNRPEARKISFWVDVSGSVSYLADFIGSLIRTACMDKDIQVVIGSEAHPEVLLPDAWLHSGQRWTECTQHKVAEYTPNFTDQVRIFLSRVKLEKGTCIVIWSDYIDINFREDVRRLFRDYRVVFLCSHERNYNTNYSGNESFKVERFARCNGYPFLWGIDSPKGIKDALRQLAVSKYIKGK